MLQQGFFTALGTPVDAEGRLVRDSYAKHVEQQIAAGCAGVLSMGSMGMQGCIRADQFGAVAGTAAEAAAGRTTVLVGAFDNSVWKVKERMDQIKGLPVAAVLTAPYYFTPSRAGVVSYFKEAAAYWGKDLYFYDHPWTARYKFNYADLMELVDAIPNLKGIKTGDLVLIQSLMNNKALRDDFTPIFSNCDLFSIARRSGVDHYLDGIFSPFPKTIAAAEKAYAAGDMENGKKHMDAIIAARDEMIGMGLWPAFTAAMNLIGCAGTFGPDYDAVFDDARREQMRGVLVRMGEI